MLLLEHASVLSEKDIWRSCMAVFFYTFFFFTVSNPPPDRKLDAVWHTGLHDVVSRFGSCALWLLLPVSQHPFWSREIFFCVCVCMYLHRITIPSKEQQPLGTSTDTSIDRKSIWCSSKEMVNESVVKLPIYWILMCWSEEIRQWCVTGACVLTLDDNTSYIHIYIYCKHLKYKCNHRKYLWKGTPW